jgi:hypothetical protein
MMQDSEVLWGVKAIADFIGIPERKAFHALSAGHLPAKKIGRAWTTTRSAIKDALTPKAPIEKGRGTA